MADTFTTNLRVRLPETGQYANSWGTVLNSEAINLLDQAITGQSQIDLNGLTTYSLAALANGASSESRQLVLKFIGSAAGAVTVTVPGTVTKKLYLVDNQCGQTISLKYAATAAVTIAHGDRKIVWCDGSTVFGITSSDAETLGGFSASDFAKIASYNVFTKGFSTPFVELVDIANIQVDCTLSNRFQVTLQGNRNIDLNTPHDGQTIEIWFKQDGTGGREIVWPLNVQFANDLDPGLSAGPNDIDAFRLTYNEDEDLWITSAVLLSPPSEQVVDISIDQNCQDVSLYERAGSPSGAYTVNVTIEPGVVVASSSVGTPAIDCTGFDASSIINLTNRGFILGRGGRGGMGGRWISLTDNEEDSAVPTPGQDAGDAILGPGAGRTLNITNAQGRIWGGGGGGGGGGHSSTEDGSNPLAAGAGGGGGAGGGPGGPCFNTGGNANKATATYGVDGSTGINGTFGTGGIGAENGSAAGGDGGDGGDWGTAGDPGESPTGFNDDVAGATGGAAGKAVELNGGTANFVSGSGAPNVIGAVS